MGFKGLSIHIARIHSQSRTWGGGAYSQDKNICAGTLAVNGRGAYTPEGVHSWDTTVLLNSTVVMVITWQCLFVHLSICVSAGS